MELINFLHKVQREIQDEITVSASVPGEAVPLPEQVFTEVFTRYMAEAGLTFEPQICNYYANISEGPVRLSGYALSTEADSLDLYVSLYRKAEEPVAISDDEVLAAGEHCARFLSLCVEGALSASADGSHDAFALIQTVELAYAGIDHIRILVLTDSTFAAADIPAVTIGGKCVSIEVIDINSLHSSLQNAELRTEFETLSGFRKDVVAAVRASAELKQDTVANAYAEDAGARLTDAEEIVDFQLCRFAVTVTGGRQLRIDGYAFDDADGSLSLVVADFSDADELQVMNEEDMRRVFGALQSYAEAALSGSLTHAGMGAGEPGIGLALDMIARRPEIVRLRLYLVTDRLSEFCDLSGQPTIADISVELYLWDIARFHKAFISDSGKDHFEVDFRSDECQGLSALHAGSVDGEYEGYLCTISGKMLADVYERYGSRLLEGNVRSFLSIKGKINSGIQTTILEKPAMFFAYNNGIAATADEVALETAGALRITIARNFQIVNGGQTTASLAAAARMGVDLSHVLVQMKLSVLPPKRAGELIPLIARFANSQNKVNESDFFANHPYHVRIEQISKRLTVPAGAGAGSHWFYERARGQYVNEQKNLSRQEKADFLLKNPKAQLLTKIEVAKLENTWKGMPHKVSTGAQKNFLFFAGWLAKSWTKNDKLFDDRYFKNLVAMAILFRHTERMVAEQPWYQGAYRPNIVTYTLALLQYMVLHKGKGRQLDMNEIWTIQAVPAPLNAFLALIAKSVFFVLTDPLRPKANVTEWAKMEACWDRARAAVPELSPHVFAMLLDPVALRAKDAEADVSEQVGYGVFASTAVKGVDTGQWTELMRWGDERNLLNVVEIKLLRSATRLPKFSPSVSDCEKIWSIRAKLIRNGFGQMDEIQE